MSRQLLILDFDGTLCLGDGPMRAFAVSVADAAAVAHAELLDPLDEFLHGVRDTVFDGCADGYTAVATWARERGIDGEALSAAFFRSRAEVDAGLVPVETLDGMVEALSGLTEWRRVLVTNAPINSTRILAGRLGLTPVLHDIIGDAAKPAGMHRLLGAHGDLDRQQWDRIVSIGDIWDNDLAPVFAWGGDTGLIERHVQPQATPTWRGANVLELLARL